jgi:hypothetical protein
MINVYKTETVLLKKKVIDAYKNVSYTTVIVPARVERKTKWLRTETGELIVSEIQLYMDFSVNIEHLDKVTVDSFDHAVLRMVVKRLFNTNNYKLVYLS